MIRRGHVRTIVEMIARGAGPGVDRVIEAAHVHALLDRLRLRKTTERVRITHRLLSRPGLPAAAIEAILREEGEAVSRRTIYRLESAIWGQEGSWARWEIVGPGWVCWKCGYWIADASDPTLIAPLREVGLLPLDLGGYCGECQRAMACDDGASRSFAGRSSRIDRRRTTAVPVGKLYGNPSLLREVLGSERRGLPRDYVAALFAENPRLGPTEIHRLLDAEFPTAPSLRSVKRFSSVLHRPKAQMLFAELGSIGWTCLNCSAWGNIADPDALRHAAPDGFVPTDLRALCSSCHNRARCR